MGNNSTQIPLKINTREKLRDLGRKGETYDQILRKLIKNFEEEKEDEEEKNDSND